MSRTLAIGNRVRLTPASKAMCKDSRQTQDLLQQEKKVFEPRIDQKIESNVELNVGHNENGRLIGARKLLILRVGTAGFEPLVF